MLRRLLRLFRKEGEPEGGIVAQATPPSPVRLSSDAEVSGDPVESTGLEGVPVESLMRLCEEYWDFLSRPANPEATVPDDPLGTVARGRYDRYVRAVSELGNRGPEIGDWARRLLRHPDYEAREQAAWWVGQLGARGQLAGAVGEVIAELRELALRPVDDEVKERQAIDAAILAIGQIGDPRGVAVLREVFHSTAWYHGDDTAWNAAESLGKLVGRPFLDEPDPVSAAREWLASHPDAGQAAT